MDEYCSELMLFGGPIGINLKSCLGGKGAYVDSFYKEPFGGVKIGDILWQINETPLNEISIEEIRQMVKNATGPMKLMFKSFPPLISCDDSDSNDIGMKQRLECATLQLLHDLRGRSWIKRIIKQTFPEVANKYAQFTLLYDCYQLLQLILIQFPVEELIKVSIPSATEHSSSNSAVTYLHHEISKMISGVVFPETSSNNGSGVNEELSQQGERVRSNENEIENVMTLLTNIEKEYKELLSKDIVPVLQNILLSEHPGMLKYRSYLYYQMKDFPTPNCKNTIGPLFPYLSISDIVVSKSGELSVLVLFLLTMKRYECAELLHRFIHHKQSGNEVECKKAMIEVMVLLIKDKSLIKFYESDHYSRLMSHSKIHYECDEEESESEHDSECPSPLPGKCVDYLPAFTIKNRFLPRIRSNVQLLDTNLNFLLSDIGISSCTSIHRPRNCGKEEKTCTNPILLSLSGTIDVDLIKDVFEDMASTIWISLNEHAYDRLNSLHLTRFAFPQWPGGGSLHLLRKAAMNVPINFVLQNFHLPSSHSNSSAAFNEEIPALLYGCSILTFSDDNKCQLAVKPKGFSRDLTFGEDCMGGTSQERRGHRSSFSETDLFQAAVAQASSFKSFASKVVTGASTYLPTLTTSSQQEAPVEIEMDEYSRSYISYDLCDDANSEGENTLYSPVIMHKKDESSIVTVPIQGFCILSSDERFLAHRQSISSMWYEFHENVKRNPEVSVSAEKIGQWMEHISVSIPRAEASSGKGWSFDCFSQEFGFPFIAESLSPQLVIVAFFAFLMEIKMALVSEEASISGHVIIGEWLKQSIKPLKYGQIYAPVLGPEVAQQVITCPAPYFSGISLQTFNGLKDTIQQMDVVVFNLSNNTIEFPQVHVSSEISLLQQIFEGLVPGNLLFDKVRGEMKKTASLIASPLSPTNKENGDCNQCDDDNANSIFPISVVKFSLQKNLMDNPISILNQLIHEMIFGVDYCLIHYYRETHESKELSDCPVILNESLFIKLKRLQMNFAPNQQEGLLFGPALGKVREGLIRTILRSQAWSTYIAQPILHSKVSNLESKYSN